MLNGVSRIVFSSGRSQPQAADLTGHHARPSGPFESASTRKRAAGQASCFIAGTENRLACVAVDTLLSAERPAFNPLLFHGPSGVGKSHLAQGLADELTARHPEQTAVRVHALDFARDHAAVETDDSGQLRRRYHAADLMVLEDVHLLECRETAQRALTLLMDALLARDATLIFTSRQAPAHLSLQPALLGRLTAGLCVSLSEPGDDAREAILEQLARQLQIDLPESARRMLAGQAQDATALQLRGMLMGLAAECRDEQAPITEERVERFLAARPRRVITLKQIAVQTGRHFRITLTDLKSASRRRAVVAARGLAMYLARRLTGQSLERIGNYFGGRDHTTVLHNCRRVESLLETDGGLQRAADELQQRLVTA